MYCTFYVRPDDAGIIQEGHMIHANGSSSKCLWVKHKGSGLIQARLSDDFPMRRDIISFDTSVLSLARI